MESKHPQATWTAFKTLLRELDIKITGEQAHWIKYRTWPHKKMKK